MICNNCGLKIKDVNICPFCGNNPNEKIAFDYTDLFKEEKINIDFNLRNILNDVDFQNEYENLQVKEANISEQYQEFDLTDSNIDNIITINNYYNKSLEIYKTKQKKNLELFDITMLQSHVASFNEIVNNCNKFKKMVQDNKIKSDLNLTIKKYNKEIHYIKKYFILPLYDTPGLLNRSRIVKALIDIVSVLFLYIFISKTGIADLVVKPILYFSASWGPVSDLQKLNALKYCVSSLAGIYLSEILFQIFINITIKNKNFQVDKNKKYDIHLAVGLIGLVLVCLKPIFFIIYSLIFAGYIIYKLIKCISTKKWNFESILEKIFALASSVYIILQIVANLK